ncbi:MAG: DegV family protein [Firmicutes bacterium]|nr:DegV family protein [Bacillota bacterium]
MNNIKIFTDSTSDLTPEIIKKYDISIIPLYVIFNEDSYKDGINIDAKKLYKKVDKYGILPRTSAPSPSDFYNSFKPFIDKGKDIIYIGLSSKLSSTIQNAKLAASEFPDGRIKIIDSLNLSTGIGLLVLKAIDYSKEGLSIDEISNKLYKLIPRVRTSFVIDTLDYLYKGGRCNAIQSFIGGVFKIKPIVKVVNGEILLGQKSRGKKKKALNTMVENMVKNKDKIDKERVVIGHSEGLKDCLYLKKQILRKMDFNEIIMIKAGCVISSHCGENTVGLYYLEK